MNLIVNAGSETVKFDLFRGDKKLLSFVYHKKSEAEYLSSLKNLSRNPKLVQYFQAGIIKKIGFRVVHGGGVFEKPVLVTKAVLQRLKRLDDLAPLHNPYARQLIERACVLFPKLPKILVFDTAFHATLPEENRIYALPSRLTKKYALRRFGFHGIVCSSLVAQLKRLKKLKSRLIICHLGGGCSVTAVKNGKSIDTSMGFTPLEGLMMATRAGDVDPGLLLYLQDKEKLSPRRLYELLNRDSGLKGMTGTPDMREVVKRAKSGSIAGRMALEIFCKRAAKAIAAQVISLGGLDQIVFSGGIGENSSEIRRKICEYLRPFGVQLDALKNNSAPAGKAFNKKMSGVLLAWLHADEAAEINRILSSLSI